MATSANAIPQNAVTGSGGYNSVSPVPIGYSCRGCNTNLASNDGPSQYQKQKIIQNTVRVMGSLYTFNLAALNAYQKPILKPQPLLMNGAFYFGGGRVNWNQMSDRASPHVQVVVGSSGSAYRGNSTKRTMTRLQPGALSPGGIGVDIKHNSYARYLNKIKGQKPLRRGVIPPNYGTPYIPFNRAFPVYGGKIIKTSIVNHCDCPLKDKQEDALIYRNAGVQDAIYSVTPGNRNDTQLFEETYGTLNSYASAINRGSYKSSIFDVNSS
jgi:hypothetical protein